MHISKLKIHISTFWKAIPPSNSFISFFSESVGYFEWWRNPLSYVNVSSVTHLSEIRKLQRYGTSHFCSSFNKHPFCMWRKFWVLIYTVRFHSTIKSYLKRSRKIWYDPFRVQNPVEIFSSIPFPHRVLAFSDFLYSDLWAIVKMIICRHLKSRFPNQTDGRKSSRREKERQHFEQRY